MTSTTLLDVKNLTVSFGKAEVVSDISFSVGKGEVLALVGESGCGKSTASLALTGLLPPQASLSAGNIIFYSRRGRVDLSKLAPRALRKYRGCGIAYIFQEPSVSLNPVMTIADQIAEMLDLHRPDIKDQKSRIIELLEQVGIPDAANRLRAYPHELSGGMQQRVMIAMALAGEPELLVADEPTTALDVTVQAQILELLQKLREERQMTILLISHNLGVVSTLADHISVMYAGRIVESGTRSQIINTPVHPYTRALLAAVPRLGHAGNRLQTIQGTVPPPSEYGKGCRFADRCQFAQPRCFEGVPSCFYVGGGHQCCCLRAGEKL